MKPIRESKFDAAILFIKALDAKIVVTADSFTTIRYLDKKALSVLEELKLAISHSQYTLRVIDATPRMEYFAFLTHNAKEVKLYEKQSRQSVASFSRHQGKIACVAIDPKGKYLFSCGEDGATFGVDIQSKELAVVLPRHLDSVEDIAFNSDGSMVATASYDKNISLFSLDAMLPKGKLKMHSAPVVKIAFLDHKRLVSIDKKSKGFVWDTQTHKVLGKLQGIHDDITQIAVAQRNELLFVGTKLGYILAYDMQEYTLISPKYIKLEHAITALHYDQESDKLFVATIEGAFYVYDVFEGEKHFTQLIEEKKYAQMLQEVERNPLLGYTYAARAFDAAWERALQQAKEFLERNDKTSALKALEPFSTIPSKRQFAQKLIQEYAEYDKFLMFVKNKKISLAYNLVKMHPPYKETKVYRALEAQWEKNFSLAKKYLLDAKMSQEVQELLKPYRGISEKTVLIQELVLNIHIYKRFRTAIAQQEFRLAFDLVKQNSFLKEYPEYKALVHYSDTLYIRAQTLLANGDTHGAVKIFRTLLDFEDFTEEAKEIIADIENRHKFFHALEAEDMTMAYTLLDRSPILQNTPDGHRLQTAWEADYARAHKEALKANAAGVKAVMQNYINVRTKYESIADLFSLAHTIAIKNAIGEHREQKRVETGIKNYILYYGITEEMKELFALFQAAYPESKISLEAQVRGEKSKWRPSMAVETIM